MGASSLKIRVREVVSADESRAVSVCVYCPSRLRTVPLETCNGCARAQNLSDQGLDCVLEPAPPVPRPAGVAANLHALCVRGDVPGRVVVTLQAREPWYIAVVDERERFVGFVASRRIARVPRGRTVLDRVPAHRLASGSVLAIHESEPLRDALRIMAHHGSRVLALVDDEGVYRGELSDVAALRGLM